MTRDQIKQLLENVVTTVRAEGYSIAIVLANTTYPNHTDVNVLLCPLDDKKMDAFVIDAARSILTARDELKEDGRWAFILNDPPTEAN